MNIEQELKKEPQYDWDNAPVICKLDDYEYRLGPQAPELLDWQEAKNWCEQIGGELPDRQVILACYLNENIRHEFAASFYWSSSEFSATTAWYQIFSNGTQNYKGKTYSCCVRAIRKYAI